MNEYRNMHIEALSCIESIVVNTSVELSNEEIESLFVLYVDQYKQYERGQDMLFTFFLKSKLRGPVLNKNNRRYLFERILCSSKRINCSTITPKVFYCFLYLFIKINHEENLLEYGEYIFKKVFKNDDGKEGKYEAEQPEIKMKNKDNMIKIIREVFSFGILGFETLWKILCTTQYEDILDQG